MIINNNITTGTPNTKPASQAIDNSKLLSTKEVSHNSTPIVDKVDIKNASLAAPSHHVRTLDAGSGQKALLVFSDKTCEVSAFIIGKDGTSKAVPSENLPKDFEMIKTLDSFNSFLENAQARGTVLSDGEAKLYVMQKGWGGMPPKKDDLTTPVTGPSTPSKPTEIHGGVNIDGFGKGGKIQGGGYIGGRINFGSKK